MNKEQYIEKYGEEAYDKKREATRKWTEQNRERHLSKMKEWYEQNKEQYLAKKKEWYEQNSEDVKQYQKEYYESKRRGDPFGYCSAPLNKIENYNLAAKDNFEGWSLHHKLEIRDGYINTVEDLKLMNLYYNRPACELIYLKKSEHTRIHNLAKSALSE